MKTLDFSKNKKIINIIYILFVVQFSIMIIGGLVFSTAYLWPDSSLGHYINQHYHFSTTIWWLSFEIPNLDITHSKWLAFYDFGNRILLQCLLLYVLKNIRKIVINFEDKKIGFTAFNVKAFMHIGHSILLFYIISMTYNLIASFILQFKLNLTGYNAATTFNLSLLLICFVSAATAYSIANIFKNGLDIQEENKTFI